MYASRLLTYLSEHLEGRVDEGHDVLHARKVYEHSKNALSTLKLEKYQKEAVLYASILHDADDSKFFPESVDYQYARDILDTARIDKNVTDLTIELIKLVSCRKNGNESGESWKLIPRYSDRLEALGRAGVFRAWVYSNKTDRVLFTDSTPSPTTQQEIEDMATPERFKMYLDGQKSKSMIDHFYDKVLHIYDNNHPNPYIKTMMTERYQETINFLIFFGERGNLPKSFYKKLKREYLK